jgi:outer membrane biosynthesis protein TonB
MSDPQIQAPTRLLADPNLDPLLRRDLELASNHAPVHYSVEAGLSRFEQALHGATTVPLGGTVAGLRVLGWFVGALALVGVGYLVVAKPKPELLAQQPSDPATTDQPATATDQPPVTPPDPVATSEVPVVAPADPSTPEPKPEPEPELSGDPPTPKPSPRPSEPKPKPSLADEAAQINAARKLLTSDPGKALALVEAAELEFPDGAMLQERRGYAILALVSLERRSEAETRADAYLERWPNGPLSRRVRDALGR